MPTAQPRYSKEVFAERGDAIYDRVRSELEPRYKDQFVAIDIETAAYEVDADELTASDRLRARIPDAQIWMRRIGYKYVHRFGPSRPLVSP
jgi:hypothetical protein